MIISCNRVRAIKVLLFIINNSKIKEIKKFLFHVLHEIIIKKFTMMNFLR